MRVPLVSPVLKVNQVSRAKRERSVLRGKRVWLALQDATGRMGRRVKLDGLALQAAKETQATEVPRVTLETLVIVVFQERMERREILDALEDLVFLAHLETLDQRERGEVMDHLVFLE